jgi:hypothetical protein
MGVKSGVGSHCPHCCTCSIKLSWEDPPIGVRRFIKNKEVGGLQPVRRRSLDNLILSMMIPGMEWAKSGYCDFPRPVVVAVLLVMGGADHA